VRRVRRLLDRAIYLLVQSIFLLINGICLLLTFNPNHLSPFVLLVIFNILFLSIFFQLEGSLTKKNVILTAGNVLGASFNLLFSTFTAIAGKQLGASSELLFSLAYPILTLLWIVPFWALSLSSLPKPQKEAHSP
jgi:hypothetical protein